MKLLVFEYSSVCLDKHLITEGFYMLKSLLSDLEYVSFFESYYLINEKYDSFNFNNCHAIYPNSKLEEWLEKNCQNYDYCLFIAPEDDWIQYTLTKILETNDVDILCSNSTASHICSSKYLTYKHVPSDILKIKTLKIDLNNVNPDKLKSLNDKFDFVIKPDNKTSSNLIYRVQNNKELENVIGLYEKNRVEEVLLQEYIPGEAVSVSILCDGDYVNCISVNSQQIKISEHNLEYVGCVTPIEHPYKKELYSLSKKIIKNIPGLKGFVGIDYIICEDKIYFVEVNARITTPFIVLKEKCNENLTEKIINMIVNKKREEITFKEKGIFTK